MSSFHRKGLLIAISALFIVTSCQTSKTRFSIQTEFHLSGIDWESSKAVEFEFPDVFKDITATFVFCPNGDSESTWSGESLVQERFVAGYIQLKDSAGKPIVQDSRFVTLTFECRGTKQQVKTRPINTMENIIGGLGFPQLFPKNRVKKEKKIIASVTIDDGYVCEHHLETAFRKSALSMYNLVQEKGDITLVQGGIDLDSHNGERVEGTVASAPSVQMSSLLLSNASPVFAQMLEHEMRESIDKRIEIPCRSPYTINHLVFFIVTKQLSATADAFDLVKLADFYQMDTLKWACLERLVDTLSPDTFVEVVQVFELYNSKGDNVAKNIFKRVLQYYEENEAITLRDIPNSKSLPFCFAQSCDYVDEAKKNGSRRLMM